MFKWREEDENFGLFDSASEENIRMNVTTMNQKKMTAGESIQIIF